MVKKIIWGMFILLVFVSCQGNKSRMILSGTCHEEKSGTYIYLYNEENQKTIDSVKVENGKFTFETHIGEPKLYRLISDFVFMEFIAEDTILHVDLSEEEQSYVRGSQLNELFVKIYRQTEKIQNEYVARFQMIIEDSTLMDEERAVKQRELGEEMVSRFKKQFEEEYPRHKKNPIGLFLFLVNESTMSEEEFVSAFKGAGPSIKNNPYFNEVMKRIEKGKKHGNRS